MADAFQVKRDLGGRAGIATSTRGDWAPVLPPPTQIGPIPGVQVHVALVYYPADPGAIALWNTALWNTGVWVDPDAVLVLEDISCDVESYSSNRGRDLPLDRFRTGTASVTVNNPDGHYSPWTDTPVGAGVYRPGIGLQVWVQIGATRYPRFTGRVTAIVDLFETTGHQQVRFDCADYLSLFAGYDGLEQTPKGAGQTSGPRLQLICSEIGYTKPRSFDAGNVTLQPTNLARNALDEAGITCDTVGGVFYCDPDGVLVHEDRNGLLADAHYTTVQATFGEVEPEICYSAVSLASDSRVIQNVVSIAAAGGTAVTIEDGASRSMYGPLTHRRFDLIHDTPSNSEVVARRHLDFYAFAQNRIEGLVPVVSLATLPALLALGLLWKIQVRRRATGYQVVTDLQVEGISETVTPTEWTMELKTFSAAAVFDVAKWDIALWNTGLWGY